MESLAKKTNKDKYKGLYLYKSANGIVYYMAYRDENNKVVRKPINNIPNITNEKARKELARVVEQVQVLKKRIELSSQNAENGLETLRDMFDFYINTYEHKTKGHTISRYKNHIQEEEFNTKIISLIKISELDKWKLKLQNKLAFKKETKLSNKTINEIILLAIRVIQYAIKKRKYDGKNPFQQIELLKVDNIKLKQMDESDLSKFFKAMQVADIRYKKDLDNNNYRIGYLFALLAVSTGARVQTILHIEIKKINFERNTIGLYNFKNEENYLGHIVNDEIKMLIREIIENNGFPNRKYLFCIKGTENKYNGYPKQVKRVLDTEINSMRDEEDRLAVRDLRNVFATRLINEGMNISHIQHLLNHKTPTMTMRYAQLLDTTGGDELKDIFSKIKI